MTGFLAGPLVYRETADLKLDLHRSRKGPVGRRTVINGLADSIWIGTKHPEEAWKWVKFSRFARKLRKIVGELWNCVSSDWGKRLKLPKSRWRPTAWIVSAFVEEAKDPQGTFFLPITESRK